MLILKSSRKRLTDRWQDSAIVVTFQSRTKSFRMTPSNSEMRLSADQRAFQKNVSLVGHSFGSGAAMVWADRNTPDRIVLLSPFNTMKKALFRKLGPLAWLIPDNIDNRKLLRTVCNSGNAPHITIIHGQDDRNLPIEMAVELAAIDPVRIKFVKIPKGTHTSILVTERVKIWDAALGKAK